MFIKNSPGIYILWIIPSINWQTSPFGAVEIRVINFRVLQVFPRRLPVDCSAGVYLLAAPTGLQFKTLWQLVKRFAYRLSLGCLSPRPATTVFRGNNLQSWHMFHSFCHFLIGLRRERRGRASQPIRELKQRRGPASGAALTNKLGEKEQPSELRRDVTLEVINRGAVKLLCWMKDPRELLRKQVKRRKERADAHIYSGRGSIWTDTSSSSGRALWITFMSGFKAATLGENRGKLVF